MLGLGLQPPWSLSWSQGPSCPEALSLSYVSLLLIFQCSLQFLLSGLHIFWDTIGCLLCSSEDQLGISPVHRGKWTPLPPTLLPSSLLWFWLSLVHPSVQLADYASHHPPCLICYCRGAVRTISNLPGLSFINLFGLVLWPNLWSIFVNVPCALEKNVYSAV